LTAEEEAECEAVYSNVTNEGGGVGDSKLSTKCVVRNQELMIENEMPKFQLASWVSLMIRALPVM
jgi:hypothetical protein